MKTLMLLLALCQEPIFKPTQQVEEKPAAKQSRREWYLVSESWCAACPAAKKRFLALGWPKQNILTIDECEKKFGFRPPHVPFKFGDPNWKAEVNSVAETPVKSGGQIYGRIGTSHESRQTLIAHLLTDGIHKGRHTQAELDAMTDEQLDSLHNQEHNQSAGTPSNTRWTIQPRKVQAVRRRRGLFFEWGG